MTSPTPSQCDTNTTTTTSDSEMESGSLNTLCSLCNDTFSMPKVLCCFHTFCQPCLEKIQENDAISCPECHYSTFLGVEGLSGLKMDYAVSNIVETSTLDPKSLHCTGCKTKETNAIARCFDCANFLCANCVMAHQFMHCFEGHQVVSVEDLQAIKEDGSRITKSVSCPKHRTNLLEYFCKTCSSPICRECTSFEHGRGHECQSLVDVADREVEMLRQLMNASKLKVDDLRGSAKLIETICSTLKAQYKKAQNDIEDTYSFYQSMLEKRTTDAFKELDQTFNTKQVAISTLAQKVQESVEKLYSGVDFIDKLLTHASSAEVLLLKNFVEQRFQNIFNFLPDLDNRGRFEIEFLSNFQAIQASVQNTFGYIQQGQATVTHKPQSLSTPVANGLFQAGSLVNEHLFDHVDVGLIKGPETNGFMSQPQANHYENWSNGLDIAISNSIDIFPPTSCPLTNLANQLLSPCIYPARSPIRRQKMIYHYRFGEFGVLEGQFTEPSGLAVNANNDIIVADTNNHRIQIFDQEGKFKFLYGQCGKHDGQLLYPNRVSSVWSTGDIVVTERSPTHQVQIYNQYGHFIRKFGAGVLQHPRGVTVDKKGRIIIVECKVMRVIIFDQYGNVLNMFGCSKYLQFPNSVVVNDKEEIFISDNRAHCVKVFSYQGVYLRQIGGEGVTNYPIGVRMNASGEIVVADNHNNFNLTIFNQEGHLLNAFESKVKHAQCFDVALMEDNSVVLASKDYKLYIYKYL